MKAKVNVEPITISDEVGRKIIEMTKKALADPKMVKKYEKWHLEKYGCMPEKTNEQAEPKVG